jgi:hypothetical protein
METIYRKVADLDLSIRTKNLLRNAGINTLQELSSFTPSSDNLALNQKFHIGAFGNTSGGIVASSELNGIIKDVFVNKF